MFLVKLLNIVLGAGAVQGFFLALLLMSAKKSDKRSNRILAALLVVLSLSIIHLQFVVHPTEGLFKFKEPFILLVGPLLLLYIRELTGTRRSTVHDTLHLIPFFLFFLVLLPANILGQDSAYGTFVSLNSVSVGLGLWTLVVGQFGYYWWKIVRIINRHQTTIEAEFSKTEGKTLSWAKTFVHVFGVFFLLLLATLALAFHRVEAPLVDALIGVSLSITIFVLGYEGLFQEAIFSGAGGVEPITLGNKQGREVRLVSPEEQVQAERILTYLEEKKPYVNEQLTLSDLATQLEMSRNQLSFVINNSLGNSFYSLINKYRVEEVKRLMSNPKNRDFTILSLAFEAGFASKSSFHTIFKNQTGLTPTQYQRRANNSPPAVPDIPKL